MDNARNNLFEELFISPEKGSGEVSIPFTSKTECLEMIRSKGKPEARIVGLAILADWLISDNYNSRPRKRLLLG